MKNQMKLLMPNMKRKETLFDFLTALTNYILVNISFKIFFNKFLVKNNYNCFFLILNLKFPQTIYNVFHFINVLYFSMCFKV